MILFLPKSPKIQRRNIQRVAKFKFLWYKTLRNFWRSEKNFSVTEKVTIRRSIGPKRA